MKWYSQWTIQTTFRETSLDEALLSWLQQFAPHGVFTLDARLRIRSWNHWMELHSSLTSADVLGRELFELFPEFGKAKTEDAFSKGFGWRIQRSVQCPPSLPFTFSREESGEQRPDAADGQDSSTPLW